MKLYKSNRLFLLYYLYRTHFSLTEDGEHPQKVLCQLRNDVDSYI
ncbi:hypothetical protein ETAE_1167 [Edwardsiella piscicida]|uniref:Uncharacterized protein n=1 Tax=Edwardsiella piscicida TaxID=1263550 RepID=A0AAU8PA77_EDWPI|nr:hypothetical protein ETAE_1167 [Edwardsiella tarda EIB202]